MNDKIKISNQAFLLLREIKEEINREIKEEEIPKVETINRNFLFNIQDMLLKHNMTYDDLYNALEEIKSKNIIKEYNFDSWSFNNSSHFSIIYNGDFFDFGEQAIRSTMTDDKERFLTFQEKLLSFIKNYNILDDNYYTEEREYFLRKYFDFVPKFLRNRRSKEDFIIYLGEVASGDGCWAKRRKIISEECRLFLDYLEFGIIENFQVGSVIFSDNLILKVPSDIKILCQEFNFNYSNAKWNSSMLLLRRILPLSIVRKFQQLGEEDEIRDKINGDFVETKKLLNKIETKLKDRRAYNDLSAQKQIIDASQHSYTLKVDESDVKNSANSIRILLDDIFNIEE